MKKKNTLITLFCCALALILAGVFTIDSNSKEASVFALPNFSASNTVTKAEAKPSPTLAEFNNSIVDIADKTTPTVVTVRVTQTVDVPENPFSRFFGMPGQGGERQRRGLGSGVIVSEDGYILTNNHVVEDAEEITVDLSDGESYDGEVVGRDPETDIAVVKIDAEGLKAISLGDSDGVRVGEMVLAIGSPLSENLAHSVSMGIISAKERAIGIIENGAGYEAFLQTDAAINPGNSGGALVNMDGELIGINSAIVSTSRNGGNDGIGFAVPSNLAENVMKSLIENGTVVRAQLGILGRNLDRELARAFNLKSSQGILVSSVPDDGPAAKAGIKDGDIIRTLNGKSVNSYSNFRTTIATSKPGENVKLGIIRDGSEKNITVTLGARDQDLASANNRDSNRGGESLQKTLGFSVEALTPEITRQLELNTTQKGVVVTTINEASNAAKKGLQRGSVIVSVNRTAVRSMNDFRNEINKAAEEDEAIVLLQVIPPGAPNMKQYVAFEL